MFTLHDLNSFSKKYDENLTELINKNIKYSYTIDMKQNSCNYSLNLTSNDTNIAEEDFRFLTYYAITSHESFEVYIYIRVVKFYLFLLAMHRISKFHSH